MGSHHGPHHSSSNKLQASEASAENVSTGGHHGDESGVGGIDTRIAKKGSDGMLIYMQVAYCNYKTLLSASCNAIEILTIFSKMKSIITFQYL